MEDVVNKHCGVDGCKARPTLWSQMAIFDSSTLAAGRLDQRKETKTSRQPADPP